MNYLQRLIEQVRIVLFITLLLDNILLFAIWYVTRQVLDQPVSVTVVCLLFGGIAFSFLLERLISSVIMQPVKLLWRNILHVSPGEYGSQTVPKLTSLWLGKDFVDSLTSQVHSLAMVTANIDNMNARQLSDLHKNFIADSLPLPLVVLDKNETIRFANRAALHYFGIVEADFVGQNLKHRLNLLFTQGEYDFDSWLHGVKTGSVTATYAWDAVRVERPEGQQSLQFDLSAFYNKDNSDACETLLVCFDHTAKYTHSDQELSLVALAVHELRTPITVLRGYIEALDEDMQGKLDSDTQSYFSKVKVSAQQLNSFINNILNVARIEGNQLEVQVQEENWDDIVRAAVEALRLRAQVRGLELECTIADNLPMVGVDRFTITEVITNLLDNAIKYSAGKGKKIVVASRVVDGSLVETSVTDSGVGIAESVIPTLFNKFQRNFHNRAVISGTGLGLYLSKTIVNAHGGNIWVSSKEGEGTTVGFTVLPYSQISDKQKSAPDSGMIRSQHGWIKNHSMSRR